jgi:hypothetical protein
MLVKHVTRSLTFDGVIYPPDTAFDVPEELAQHMVKWGCEIVTPVKVDFDAPVSQEPEAEEQEVVNLPFVPRRGRPRKEG